MRNLTLLVPALCLVAVSGLQGGQLRAQAETASDNATFEVASVKVNKTGDNRIGIGFAPGGRFRATNVPLRELISAAYGTPQPLAAFQITGGPKWIETDRFDIVAKAPGDPQPGPNGPPPVMFSMLRNLLAERFHLAVHHETKEVPIYALVLARADGTLGPQLHPAATDCAALMASARARGGAPPTPPAPGERMPCGMRMFPGNLSGGGASLTMITTVLGRFVNRTVVDRTGLAGNYDFDLRWTPDQLPQGRGDPAPGEPPPAIDPNGASIFTAVQEQLGLKLDGTRGPVDVLVIDRADRPTED